MLVNYIFSVSVKQCQLVCTQGGSQIRNLLNSNRVRTRRGVLKTWSCHTFNESDHIVKWRVSTRRVHRKRLMLTVLMAFMDTATMCLKPWDALFYFCPCQEARPALTEEEYQRGIKKSKLDKQPKQYIQENGYNLIEMY